MACGANSILGAAQIAKLFSAQSAWRKNNWQSAIDKNSYIKVGRVAHSAWRKAYGANTLGAGRTAQNFFL